MKYLKHFSLTIMLIFFVSCKETKTPKKDTVKEHNVSHANLGELSKNQLLIEKKLEEYLKELATFNTDAIVDMTYPKLFHVIDLDLFRQYIASMMNSTDIKMKSYESNINKISNVTAFSNGTQFAQTEYTSTIVIQFINNKLYNTEEKMNFLYDALIHKYGDKNIKIDVKKRTLQIKKPEKLLLIKEKGSEWKFLGDNSKYRQLYPSFLPNEILRIIEKSDINNHTKIKGKDTNETI